MSIRDDRREAALDRMADHLLATGLGNASLRALAAAAGTSDRMLLYYFADKDELLSATLERIAGRLTTLLDLALPPGTQLGFAPLLSRVWAAIGSPALRPYMRLWLELAAAAARNPVPHGAIAEAIMAGFVDWGAAHLDNGEGGRDASPALLLATMEGLLFLDAVGRRDLADAAVAAVAGP